MSNKIIDMLHKTNFFFYFCISAVFLYFVFSPAIDILFYTGDSLRYTFGGLNKYCRADDGYYFMLTLGRPLQAYLDCMNFKFAPTMERMMLLRIFSIGLLATSIALFAIWLSKLHFSFWTSLFAASMIILLPGLYADTIFTAATSLPFSFIFTITGYLFIQKAHDIPREKNKKYYMAGCLFVLMSLLTYPAITFFYGTLMLSKALFNKINLWETTRRELFIETFLFGTVCIIYFIGAFINMHYNSLAPVPVQYHLDHPNFSLTEIISRLTLIGNVFGSLWQILPNSLVSARMQGWAICIILTAGLFSSVLFSIKTKHLYESRFIWQAIFAIIFLLLLSSVFFLIIPKLDVGSRLLLGPLSSGMLLMLWSLSQILKFLPTLFRKSILGALVCVFVIFESHYANVLVLSSALFYEKTTNFIKDSLLAQKDMEKIKRIHFVLHQPDYPYNRFFQTNGVMSALFGQDKYKIHWCSLPRGIEGKEEAHQNEMLECLAKLPENAIAITYSYTDETYTTTPGMMIIRSPSENV